MTTLIPPDVIHVWQQSAIPVQHTHTLPPDTTTFHQLTSPAIIAQFIHHIQQHGDGTQRTAALVIVHYVVGTLTTLLIAPYAISGYFFDVTAQDIGIDYDPNGALTRVWINPYRAIQTKQPLSVLAHKLQSLIMPIFTVICRHAKLPVRGSQLVMYDALRRHTRLALQKAGIVDIQWIASLLEALGDTNKLPFPSFIVQPDAGPAVQWEQPRVCCVLAKTTDTHSCPHCPKHALAYRIDATETWLRTMSDIDFKIHTGRNRQ
jgi:ferric iron reductase protein FhuF